MRQALVAVALFLLSALPPRSHAAHYAVEKVADGAYAAIALPEGKGGSNALIVVMEKYAVAAGAHFHPDATGELLETVRRLTPLPLRYVILTHHHQGHNYLDFDFPPEVEVVASSQTAKSLRSELREWKNPIIVVEKGLTLQQGKRAVVVTHAGEGHTAGDLFIAMPEERLLFLSDLLFHEEVGSLSGGNAREWVLTLQALEGFPARRVVPGKGGVTGPEGIRSFRVFLQDFLTEALRHAEKGEQQEKEETEEKFSLPQYENMKGYRDFLDENLLWALREVQR